jgi:hypothetical protein
MHKKIFNKFLLSAILILIILASVIKIHSVLSFPEISDWNYHQLQRIDLSKKEFSFAVFGDNRNSVKTFGNLIEKVNQEDVIFAIDVGDLVYDGEKGKYRFFINQINKLNKPLLTVIGNHELKREGRANYYELFGKFYYSFVVGDSYFIILDDANARNLDPWQMDWLKDELQKSQNYKYRFVFMHVPLYDPRKGQFKVGHSLKDSAFANELNNLFDENDINMLFVAHIHGYYKGIWGKTPYIITGGAGARLSGSDPQHDFFHYIKVNVSDSGVEYVVVKLPSPDFEWIDRLAHDAGIYVYAFFALHFWDLIIILSLICLGFYFVFYKKNG